MDCDRCGSRRAGTDLDSQCDRTCGRPTTSLPSFVLWDGKRQTMQAIIVSPAGAGHIVRAESELSNCSRWPVVVGGTCAPPDPEGADAVHIDDGSWLNQVDAAIAASVFAMVTLRRTGWQNASLRLEG